MTPGVNRIALPVTDTGSGMDAETINHIFEPFFTTKHERGAGLGLAIVHGLVQQFGGTISVQSAPRCGTTFTLTLPVVTDTPVPTGAPQPVADDTAPGALLIVEGDTRNRQLLRRLLTDLDRPVLATATAARSAWPSSTSRLKMAGHSSGDCAKPDPVSKSFCSHKTSL